MQKGSSNKILLAVEVIALTLIVSYFISDGFTLTLHQALGFDGSDNLNKTLWGSGLDPKRALISLAVIVVFFGFLYWKNRKKGGNK